MKATGQRRRVDSSKGTKATAKLPGGSRTIKPLAEVCRVEGVPEPQPLSPGEQRTLRETLSENFFATIAKAQVVPRRSGRRRGTADRRWKPRTEVVQRTLDVRIPLLCYGGTAMAGIDYRVLRCDVGMEAVLDLLGFAP